MLYYNCQQSLWLDLVLVLSLWKFDYQACDVVDRLWRVFLPQLPGGRAELLTSSFGTPAK